MKEKLFKRLSEIENEIEKLQESNSDNLRLNELILLRNELEEET